MSSGRITPPRESSAAASRETARPAVLLACSAVFSTGGIQRFNRNLVRAWHELGATVDVVTLADEPERTAATHDGAVRYACAGRNKALWCRRLAGRLASRRHDLVLCGHVNLAPAVIALARLLSPATKTILILHGVEVWGRMRGIKRYASRAFDEVLAVSTCTRRSFLDQVAGFPPDRARVFPNTINPELAPRFGDRVPRAGGALHLLSVARLAKSELEKGIRHVLEALASADGLDYRYTIIGDGDDRAALFERAAELGIADRVSLSGNVDDDALAAAYERADVFVLPSRKEGFGIVFLEAMRFGLPVIAAAEKGAVDVVHDGRNGLLVPYGDVGAIRAVIGRLAADPQLRAALGRRARLDASPGGPFGFAAFRERVQRLLP